MNKENELKENEIVEPLKRQNRYLNTANLTQEEIIQRENDIKELSVMFPRLPEEWIAMVWNYCLKTPIEEQERIIKEKSWEKPIPRFSGGELIAYDIIPKTETEQKQTEEIEKLKLDLEENDGEEDDENEKYEA